ncbi:MAG: RNA polymerase factor sigma-54 [Rhodospirillaceae bacterium]|nr:RNA polymerase factor sigma-54 [Rhodospirillaceae bacterium]
MALTQKLELRQSHSLVMTPQLQQAIKLLELSNLELAEFIEAELERNPLLDRDEPGTSDDLAVHSDDDGAADPIRDEPAPAVADAAEFARAEVLSLDGDQPLDADERDLWEDADPPAAGEASAAAFGRERPGSLEDWDPQDDAPAPPPSLREHLMAQLCADVVDPVDRLIAQLLVDHIDSSGYFVGDLGAVADSLGCPISRVEAVLKRIQRLDPVGVGARTLAECLAAQLDERDRLDPAMQALLDNLDLLARRDRDGLMAACGVDAEDLADMIAEIKALDPRPAANFDAPPPAPVVPDIIVSRQRDGGWLVELNTDSLPRVLVNNAYYRRLGRQARSVADREYLATQLHAASWLVRSVHQRATTILKVATEIVRRQEAFLLHGVEHLKPLVRREIAEAIGMHESTVSRVTTNKFMATPRGTLELRYFFTASIASSQGGDAHSAEAVRSRIRALIESERDGEVLSDDRIVSLLRSQGIDIARRTVAKYRESLRIPSSVERRRERSLRTL